MADAFPYELSSLCVGSRRMERRADAGEQKVVGLVLVLVLVLVLGLGGVGQAVVTAWWNQVVRVGGDDGADHDGEGAGGARSASARSGPDRDRRARSQGR